MSVTLRGTEQTARHEAAHASAWLCLGLQPAVARIDWPSAAAAGEVRLDWVAAVQRSAAPRRCVKAVIIGLLMPAIQDGVLRTEWPVEPEDWANSCRDAELIKRLAAALGFDQLDWLGILCTSRRLFRSRRYPELAAALSSQLLEIEVIERDELVAIMDEVDGRLAREQQA